MRTLSILLMLAASAAPAMAQDDDDRGRRGANGDRAAEASADRESYRRDSGRSERPAMSAEPDRRERTERQRPERDRGQASVQTFEVQREAQAPAQVDRHDDDGARGSGMRRRGYDGGQRTVDQSQLPSQQDVRQSRGWQPRDRRVRTIPDGNVVAAPVGMTSPERPASTVERRHYNRDGRGWNQRWRHDSRFDWRRHRDRHRSIFRVGFYYDPFGWDYRRFGIGSYMWPSYFGSRYWISDPWRYRLPPAYGPYRWVRYHNDALLIDTWTGQVVDVIYGFFW